MKRAPEFAAAAHDARDPSPWQAVFLDRSIPLADGIKQAWLEDASSYSRQFLLPIVRPLARVAIVLVQVVKVFVPNAFTSSRLLHWILAESLKRFVTPNANLLILRHFHLGAEILDFIGRNVPGVAIPPLAPMRVRTLDDLKADTFLNHDLNIYNFIIYLNRQLREQGRQIEPCAEPDFGGITDGALPIDPLPHRWSNVIDLQTAIELYTPVYQLFLTDNDFWRATNSLQLDETLAIYASRILDDPLPLLLVNNKHPMVPESTLRAGARLVLHGLATEMLHAFLVHRKREQAARRLSRTPAAA